MRKGWFLIFLLISIIIYFIGGSAHWIANIVNQYSNTITNQELLDIVYFFDEYFGHMVPFSVVGVWTIVAIYLEGLNPLKKNYSNKSMLINLLLSIVFGALWGLLMIEGSSAVLALIFLSPMIMLTVYLTFINNNLKFKDFKKLPFTHFAFIYWSVTVLVLISWYAYFGEFTQVSELV